MVLEYHNLSLNSRENCFVNSPDSLNAENYNNKQNRSNLCGQNVPLPAPAPASQ